MMKKTYSAVMAAVLSLSALAASAMDLSASAGSDFVAANGALNAGGIGLTADWLYNDDLGYTAGLGLGLGVPLGSALVTLGGKAMYVDLDDRDNGGALAVGGTVQWPLGEHFKLLGGAWYAPESLASGIGAYTEASAGVRFNLTRLVGAELGYKYVKVESDDDRPATELANGVYGGVTFSF
ncbi:YfaZ family outer membrane protein [Chitiniphilus shinanonensis]|nr:YfaZ family outer membrane protein [Chitiniphilus shinanonensis]